MSSFKPVTKNPARNCTTRPTLCCDPNLGFEHFGSIADTAGCLRNPLSRLDLGLVSRPRATNAQREGPRKLLPSPELTSLSQKNRIPS